MQYEKFLNNSEGMLTGLGLGAGGGSQVEAAGDRPGYIDGGLLMSYVALGMLAASLYLGGLFACVARVFLLVRKLPDEGFYWKK